MEDKCDKATNNLRVIYNKPEEGEPKKKFAVCVKGLFFPFEDVSIRLAEWIELLHELGAGTIYFYVQNIHDNMRKVLDLYEVRDWVEVSRTSFPGYFPSVPLAELQSYWEQHKHEKRQLELVPYNDCFYRNIYRHQYIALLDIDEVIMPLKHTNWEDMMREAVQSSLKVKNETRASWNFRPIYFLDRMLPPAARAADIPAQLHMLQHVYRSGHHLRRSEDYGKTFLNPERVLLGDIITHSG